MIGIYCIKNLVNGKRYIGSSVNVLNRFSCHKMKLRKGIHPNKHLQTSWNKYGESNFLFSIVEECSKENILEREAHYIKETGSFHNELGYNLELNPLTRAKSQEHKTKISESIKRRYKEGFIHPNTGKTCKSDTKTKIANKLRHKKQSKDTIERRVKHLFKPVEQLDMDGKLLNSFISISDASKKLNIKQPHITRCCRGGRKSTGGFIFRYREVL